MTTGQNSLRRPLNQWARENKVTLHFITPGQPMENSYIESFHGEFREECLKEHWFHNLNDARETIESWRIDYNQARPRSALGYLTPEEYGNGCANLESAFCFPDSHSRDGGCEQIFAAKLKPEHSHLCGLSRGGSSQ